MKCFNHRDADAIGICKACQKALCAECANDLDHGLACKDKHETEVEALNTIVSRATRAHSSAPKGIVIGPLFYATMGIIFTVTGFLETGDIRYFMSVFGIAFIILALVVYQHQRKIYRERRPNKAL